LQGFGFTLSALKLLVLLPPPLMATCFLVTGKCRKQTLENEADARNSASTVLSTQSPFHEDFRPGQRHRNNSSVLSTQSARCDEEEVQRHIQPRHYFTTE
jgi:hypothetical protein